MQEDIVSYSMDEFNALIMNLIVSMGYGGGRKQVEMDLTLNKDEKTVEGIINEDVLGLRKIFLKAKHTEDKILIDEINSFTEFVNESNVENGVFITISDFEIPVNEEKNSKIRLVNGKELHQLIFNFGI
ncbi:MAG: restriction endonuclease [Methanobrevibacter sp.]|nr:restriction endonuclease [Candidatus Methanoflexus mossambicus]